MKIVRTEDRIVPCFSGVVCDFVGAYVFALGVPLTRTYSLGHDAVDTLQGEAKRYGFRTDVLQHLVFD